MAAGKNLQRATAALLHERVPAVRNGFRRAGLVLGENAARIAEVRPIMLAGGVNPGNAARLVRMIRPAGIDLASGVESAPGIKDMSKVRKLFENLKGLEL